MRRDIPKPSGRELSISTQDWPSLEETIGKVSKLTVVNDKVSPDLALKGSSSIVSSDSGNEEPPELWKDSKSVDVESWADLTPSTPSYGTETDGEGIASSGSSTSGCEVSPKFDRGTVSMEHTDGSSSVPVAGSDPPAVDSSLRRKSSKGFFFFFFH